MKPTRRELATAAVAAALAGNAEAQAPASDIAKIVHDANQRNSDTLTKFELPIATEPAFRFEA
jgi:hypothetical protein